MILSHWNAVAIVNSNNVIVITILCADNWSLWKLWLAALIEKTFLAFICSFIIIYWTIEFYVSSFLQVSPRLQGFLDRMLVRDPTQRATAPELLQHPFLREAGPPTCLMQLMRSFRHSPCWFAAFDVVCFDNSWYNPPTLKLNMWLGCRH